MLTKAEIQRIRSLQEKKSRELNRLFVVEGAKVISELIKSKYPITEIYATKDWNLSKATLISEEEMTKISHLPTPSEVLALCPVVHHELKPEALNEGLTLALDTVQDPGNVGALLRIADWYAIDRVILSKDCADLFSPKVIDSSKGSFARVKTYSADLESLLAQTSVPILGCDLRGDDIHTLAYTPNAVLVIGSEGKGIAPNLRRMITRFITIPKYGSAESLNAAIAGAIVCDVLKNTKLK
jgi:TrmH family RNA methyltransferase